MTREDIAMVVYFQIKKWENCLIKTKWILESSVSPGSSVVAPYALVGDDAFPLKHYLMKRNPGKLLGDVANT